MLSQVPVIFCHAYDRRLWCCLQIADCPATYNLQSQGSLSASCHQSSPSGSSAALTGARQTAAGAPKYGGLTAIPLSQHVYHPAQTPFPQVSVSWDSFVRHHGHSLETVQVWNRLPCYKGAS